MGFEDVGWSQNKTKTHGITKIKEQRNQNKKQTNKKGMMKTDTHHICSKYGLLICKQCIKAYLVLSDYLLTDHVFLFVFYFQFLYMFIWNVCQSILSKHVLTEWSDQKLF